MTRLILSVAVALSLPLVAGAQTRMLDEFNTQRLDQTLGFDAELRQIAFDFLKGKTRSEAQEFLEQERYRCVQNLCKRVIIDKETAAQAGTTFGKRRTTRASFSVELLSDVIRTPQDLTANFLLEEGMVPWHRRPKDSDLTVIHD